MPRKFQLDYRKKRVYSPQQWARIIRGHVSTHKGIKPEDCAGCKELNKRMIDAGMMMKTT